MANELSRRPIGPTALAVGLAEGLLLRPTAPVRHKGSSPISSVPAELPASISSGSVPAMDFDILATLQPDDGTRQAASCAPLLPAQSLIRMQQNRDFIKALTEWQAATGADRAYWRGRVRRCIAAERRYLAEGQALMQAAAASHRRAA